LAFSDFEGAFVPPFSLTAAPSAGFCNPSHLLGSTQIAEASLQHCTQQDMIHKSIFHPDDSLPDIFFCKTAQLKEAAQGAAKIPLFD
jgi:hypothetical protein